MRSITKWQEAVQTATLGVVAATLGFPADLAIGVAPDMTDAEASARLVVTLAHWQYIGVAFGAGTVDAAEFEEARAILGSMHGIATDDLSEVKMQANSQEAAALARSIVRKRLVAITVIGRYLATHGAMTVSQQRNAIKRLDPTFAAILAQPEVAA